MKIENYPSKATPVLADKILGTDTEEADPTISTKNFSIQAIKDAMEIPEDLDWLPATWPSAADQIIKSSSPGNSEWVAPSTLINDAGSGSTDFLSAAEIDARIVAMGATKAPVYVAVPLTRTSAGNPGEYAFTTTYMYICVAVNTWRRVKLASW